MNDQRRKRNILLFSLYCAVMLWLLFDRVGGIEGVAYWDQIRANLNLRPFRTIRLFLSVLTRPAYGTAAFTNLGGNVILFIPLGFFLPRIFPRLQRLWRTGLATALIITAVELGQLFTLLGSCDIDDLILNVTGATMGYGFHKLIK